MTYDPEAIRQALARVRERSVGPTAVQDLAALLEATHQHVRRLDGQVTALQSTLDTERLQRDNTITDAERGLAAAQASRDAAEARAESLAARYDLAYQLGLAMTQVEGLEASLAAVRQTIEDERAETQTTCETLMGQLQQAHEATQIAQATAERHERALQQIAQAPWWEQSGRDVARETLS